MGYMYTGEIMFEVTDSSITSGIATRQPFTVYRSSQDMATRTMLALLFSSLPQFAVIKEICVIDHGQFLVVALHFLGEKEHICSEYHQRTVIGSPQLTCTGCCLYLGIVKIVKVICHGCDGAGYRR